MNDITVYAHLHNGQVVIHAMDVHPEPTWPMGLGRVDMSLLPDLAESIRRDYATEWPSGAIGRFYCTFEESDRSVGIMGDCYGAGDPDWLPNGYEDYSMPQDMEAIA